MARGFSDADVDIGLVTFGSGATLNSTVFKPSQITNGQALDAALEALRSGGSTNFEAGLQQAINFFNGQADKATANNLAFFLSDGFPNSTTDYLDEAATLKSFAEVSAVGVGTGSSLATLQPIDDTGGAQQVTTSDALRAALQDSPLTPATITAFELIVDGVTVPGIDKDDLTGGPNAFSYSVQDAAGLEITDDDVVQAKVTFSDGTILLVDTVVDGRDLSVFGV